MVQCLLLISVAVNDKVSYSTLIAHGFVMDVLAILEKSNEKIFSFEKVWISCSQPRTYNKIEDFTNIEDSSPKFGTFCYFVLLYEEFGMERFGDYDVSRMARGSRTVIKGGKNWPVNLEKIFENITIHNNTHMTRREYSKINNSKRVSLQA
ncbi:unnamed protein product [Rhizophagus irregularis]|nr:unnamed protein product [Rhizophagus irregularis]